MAGKSGTKDIVMNSKKIGELQEKAIRIIKFLPNDAPVTKSMKKLKIRELKNLTTLQNILFVKIR